VGRFALGHGLSVLHLACYITTDDGVSFCFLNESDARLELNVCIMPKYKIMIVVE